MAVAELVLKDGRDLSLKKSHPWIFSGAFQNIPPSIKEGDEVKVLSAKKQFLACGIFSKNNIAVKIFSFIDIPLDEAFFRERLVQALNLRTQLKLRNTASNNCFRLINGEGDYLPGLIIDVYHHVAVIQAHSIGIWKKIPLIKKILTELLPELAVIFDKSKVLEAQNKTESDSTEKSSGQYLLNNLGTTKEVEVLENRLKFLVNWEEGQKTGFFLDQRESRLFIQTISQGRDVLNAFSYTGGFSVYALSGGANSVVSLDSSKSALDLAKRNIEINFPDEVNKHQIVQEDCFNYLDTIKDRFDLIILDPPAFAKNRMAINRAERGYEQINFQAIKNIRKGGILATFSCSQLVTKDSFDYLVLKAAQKAGRQVSLIKEFAAAPCHPINFFHPEGSYLKGLALQVF